MCGELGMLVRARGADELAVAQGTRPVDGEVEPGVDEAEPVVRPGDHGGGVLVGAAVVGPVADRAGGASGSVAAAGTWGDCVLTHPVSLSCPGTRGHPGSRPVRSHAMSASRVAWSAKVDG